MSLLVACLLLAATAVRANGVAAGGRRGLLQKLTPKSDTALAAFPLTPENSKVDWSQGTRMRDLYVGRCLQAAWEQSVDVDCAAMWDDFVAIIKGRSVCDVLEKDYQPFYDKWGDIIINPSRDHSVFWDLDRAKILSSKFASDTGRRRLEDTVAGQIQDRFFMLCGTNATRSGLARNYEDCNVPCPARDKAGQAYGTGAMWAITSDIYARKAAGTIYVVLDSPDDQPVYAPGYFRDSEVPMMTANITKMVVLPVVRGKKGEGCGKGSLLQLEKDARKYIGPKVQFECIEDQDNIRHILCGNDDLLSLTAYVTMTEIGWAVYNGTAYKASSGAPLCQFKTPSRVYKA